MPGGSGSTCSSSHKPNSSALGAARNPGSFTKPKVLKRSPRGNLRQIRGGFSRRFRLVDWLVFLATGECQGQQGAKTDSDPSEKEKIAFGLEERLHRAVIDISLANREARQFRSLAFDRLERK